MFLCGCGVEMVAESTMEIFVESGEDFGNNLFLKISILFLKKDVIFWRDISISFCMSIWMTVNGADMQLCGC